MGLFVKAKRANPMTSPKATNLPMIF